MFPNHRVLLCIERSESRWFRHLVGFPTGQTQNFLEGLYVSLVLGATERRQVWVFVLGLLSPGNDHR